MTQLWPKNVEEETDPGTVPETLNNSFLQQMFLWMQCLD